MTVCFPGLQTRAGAGSALDGACGQLGHDLPRRHKAKVSGGMALRLPMTMTLPQSTPMSVMKSDAATAVQVWRSDARPCP